MLWVDFENVCVGPVEWDVAHLPSDLQSLFARDPDLVDDLRMLTSWVVSVWCWRLYDRSDEKREAAEFHLQRIQKWMKRKDP